MEQSAGIDEKLERGTGLYTITRIPPDMMLCTNQEGAMKVLNRGRTTIWRLIQGGSLRGFNVTGNVVIPLADIAGLLGVTERQVYNIALAHKLPLWQIYRRG